jgi:small multidrug resistance family-3 protein
VVSVQQLSFEPVLSGMETRNRAAVSRRLVRERKHPVMLTCVCGKLKGEEWATQSLHIHRFSGLHERNHCAPEFELALTCVDAVAAERAFAPYGGIYILASLLWLWAVEKSLRTAGDLRGAGICLGGAAVILLGPGSH